ncbi:MAG: multiheme c-type cytochrome [Planctomycetota bacterium]
MSIHNSATTRCSIVWLFCTGLFCTGCSNPSGTPPAVQPLEASAAVHRVTAEDWATMAVGGGPGGNGWVLLPEQPSADQPAWVSPVKPEERGFLAADACRECHAEQYDTYVHTAHARTSMLPSPRTILGSFQPGRNEFSTATPGLRFRMLSEDGRFLQRLQLDDSSTGTRYQRDFPIDLVLGSGNHGQSYLYWDNDRLYQLHVSYLTESDGWVNSPGPYYDGTADFARPIPVRCIECHATWIAADVKSVNRFDRSTLVAGIGCVRCHGPGHEHVEFHRQFPDEHIGRRIVQPRSLSVQRQNEICAQCHSAGEVLGSAFGYRPGQALGEWMELELATDSADNADPHSANQLARLMKSRCFTSPEGLSCVTCHDPHRSQQGQLAAYATTCTSCHQPSACPDVRMLGTPAESRCVECHMPARRDAQVRMETASGNIQALLRDHLIGRWPEASALVRRQLAPDTQQGHGSNAGGAQEVIP